MKNIFKVIFALIIFILSLCFPFFIIESTKYGLKLWYLAVLPSLFPYMVISNYIILSGISGCLALPVTPITRLLHINQNCAASIISGLLFGYPSCASSAILSCQKGIIGKKEACYCSCAFNNLSPSFIIGYFCVGIYKEPALAFPVMGIFYLSLTVSALIIRFVLFKNINTKHNLAAVDSSQENPLDAAVIKAIYNVVKLGGYIVVFSIAALGVLKLIAPFGIIGSGIIEITTGINKISAYFDRRVSLMILIPLMSFGGISGIFQTFGIDTEHIIDRKKYIYSKLISMLICSIVSYLTIYVLKII